MATPASPLRPTVVPTPQAFAQPPSQALVRYTPPRTPAVQRAQSAPRALSAQRHHPVTLFLLRHQEVIAALVGAITILICGVLFMRCRGG
jgi:hypothetical protein